MPEQDIWDEIEGRLRGDYDEDERMAGNTKPQNQWVIPLVVAIVAGVVSGAANRVGGEDSAESKQLTIVTTKLEYVTQQVELLAKRPFITRDEFDREFSRLDRRLSELERSSKSGGDR